MSLPDGSDLVLCVVGARPNFIKIAPILKAFDSAEPPIRYCLIHTGQHYDDAMQQQFFDELDIPEPAFNLEVGSGSHAVQTAQVMLRFEPVLEAVRPSAVLVVGDVNSTLACALVATKKHVAVFHVEAGLRSQDRSMPEEINRILTDQISELLFTTEEAAESQLLSEGICASRIIFAGNVMIDTLRGSLERAVPKDQTLLPLLATGDVGRLEGGYGVVTLHRPSNVDDPAVFARLMQSLADLSKQLPLVFPLHPRTRQKLTETFGDLAQFSGITFTPPLGYLQMLGLVKDARLVLTDSGGLQEETSALGIPCLTLRDTTERPITVDLGTNRVVGTSAAAIAEASSQALSGSHQRPSEIPGWDGQASSRIAHGINQWLAARRAL